MKLTDLIGTLIAIWDDTQTHHHTAMLTALALLNFGFLATPLLVKLCVVVWYKILVKLKLTILPIALLRLTQKCSTST